MLIPIFCFSTNLLLKNREHFAQKIKAYFYKNNIVLTRYIILHY